MSATATQLEPPRELLDVMGRMKKPVVVGHVVPDADCLGSMFAVARSWPSSDGDGAVACLPEGSLSQRLAFLVDLAGVKVAGAEALADADGFICVDTAKKPRCNVGKSTPETWSDGRPVVNIDHHESNTRYGNVNWVESKATSAAELVFQAIRATDRPVTPQIASLLYAGIYTDTRGFTLPGTTAGSLETAAELVRAGADLDELSERLYRSQQKSEFDLLGTIYKNTKVAPSGRIAYSTADYAEITGCGCTAADIDEQVDIPRSLAGAQMAFLFTEGNKGKTRINLRGEGKIVVLPLAKELGGGGHEQAAGAILECPIAEAVEKVLPMAEMHLNKQDPR